MKKINKLFPLLVLPLMLASCSETEISNTRVPVKEWLENDVKAFQKFYMTPDQKAVMIPYDETIFNSYKFERPKADKPEEMETSYTSNYTIRIDPNVNKLILTINGATNETVDHYYQTVSLDKDWKFDELKSSSDNHDYYFNRDLPIAKKAEAVTSSASYSMNFYLKKTDFRLVLSFNTLDTFKKWPSQTINSYFALKPEDNKFPTLDVNFTKLFMYHGTVNKQRYLDFYFEGEDLNALKGNIETKLNELSFKEEPYHFDSANSTCYYVNVVSSDKKKSSSFDVYVDRTIKDNKLKVRFLHDKSKV